MANKPITQLPQVENLKEDATVFVNNGGSAAQVPVSAIGGGNDERAFYLMTNYQGPFTPINGGTLSKSEVMSNMLNGKAFILCVPSWGDPIETTMATAQQIIEDPWFVPYGGYELGKITSWEMYSNGFSVNNGMWFIYNTDLEE